MSLAYLLISLFSCKNVTLFEEEKIRKNGLRGATQLSLLAPFSAYIVTIIALLSAAGQGANGLRSYRLACLFGCQRGTDFASFLPPVW